MSKTNAKRSSNDEDKLTERVDVRFSKSHLNDILIPKSKKLNMPLASTIRFLALNSNITIHSITDVETSIQLRKIGTNINQIARRINYVMSQDAFNYELVKLDDFVKEVQEVLKQLKD